MDTPSLLILSHAVLPLLEIELAIAHTAQDSYRT